MQPQQPQQGQKVVSQLELVRKTPPTTPLLAALQMQSDEERQREVQDMIQFFKEKSKREISREATTRFDSASLNQIESTAMKKIMEYSTLEESEKALLKSTIKRGVCFNVGLVCVYKFAAHPGSQKRSSASIRPFLKFLSFKRGLPLWMLSPLAAHYDCQDIVLRLGVKYWLLKNNSDLTFPAQQTQLPKE